MKNEKRVLGIFGKRPQPGQVKTRLAAETTPTWAAQVAAAFLGDTLDSLATIAARRILAFAPAGEADYFTDLVAGRFELTPQSEGDLGRRLSDFFSQRFEEDAEAVVVVGTDSPTLPSSFIAQAFERLENADVVLGPATDGGYYLIGCSRWVPPIFDGVAWSGPRVLSQTITLLSRAGLRLALLSPWYDVDTLDDWWMLRGHIQALREAGSDPGLKRIAALPDPPL